MKGLSILSDIEYSRRPRRGAGNPEVPKCRHVEVHGGLQRQRGPHPKAVEKPQLQVNMSYMLCKRSTYCNDPGQTDTKNGANDTAA